MHTSPAAGSALNVDRGPTGPTPEADDDGFVESPFQSALREQALERQRLAITEQFLAVECDQVVQRRNEAMEAFRVNNQWHQHQRTCTKAFSWVLIAAFIVIVGAILTKSVAAEIIGALLFCACVVRAIQALRTKPPHIMIDPFPASEEEPQIESSAPSVVSQKIGLGQTETV